jgi:GNAT superfamily N-acetyltransferase
MPKAQNNATQFHALADVAHTDYHAAMSVYHVSFPVHERRDEATTTKRVRDGFYRMYVGRLGERVVFLALIHPIGNTEFALLDYMATHPEHRNQKIGESFLKFLAAELQGGQTPKRSPDLIGATGRGLTPALHTEETALKYLLLEVEDPAFGDNREQRARRVRFYARCGAKTMKDVRYIMPVKPGYPPEEMVLMVLPQYDDGALPGALARKIITGVYREVYGRDENDPLLNSFINEIPQTVHLQSRTR